MAPWAASGRQDRKPMTNDEGKSDVPMVPTKRSNDAERTAEEGVEGRGTAEGNVDEQNGDRTQRRKPAAPSELARVRERARRDRKAKFTALLHHVTIDRLRDAFRGDARHAPGPQACPRAAPT